MGSDIILWISRGCERYRALTPAFRLTPTSVGSKFRALRAHEHTAKVRFGGLFLIMPTRLYFVRFSTVTARCSYQRAFCSQTASCRAPSWPTRYAKARVLQASLQPHMAFMCTETASA